jgi:hypothetical protein
MAKKHSTKAKADRQFLKDTAERFNIPTKGLARTLDRLKWRPASEIGKMADLMEEGFSLDMVDELFSKGWEKDVRRSGGERGGFKSMSQKKFFENKYKDEKIKQYEENKKRKIPKLTPAEKKALKEKDMKEFNQTLERNRAYNPTIRSKEFSEKVLKDFQNGKKTKWTNIIHQVNDDMKLFNVKDKVYIFDARNGIAVAHYMHQTGADKTKAMQTMIYDRIDALPDQYETPTEIPKGISVSPSALQRINDTRAIAGLSSL